MQRIFGLIVFVSLQCSLAAVKRNFLQKAALDRAKSHSMLKLHPYYHSTNDIHSELVQLSSRCPGMKLESRNADSRSIDVVSITAPGSSPVNKNFMLFGEHARELISPESGLHFIKTLCGETGNKERAAKILQDSEFQIVVNGNPESRKHVEQGDFCLRVNPSGVDLNRNWDEAWESDPGAAGTDTNPGPRPFSEPETQVFKDLVTAYRPTNFLTIHSGTKGMYMPWAYDMEHLAKRNQPAMIQILKDLDKDYCECPFGAAGREVGYSCPGTCLDWVYDHLQTPYAFAFEIYANPLQDGFLKQRWQEKMADQGTSFLQNYSNLAHEHFQDIFKQCPSDFVQLQQERHPHPAVHKDLGQILSEHCFSNFNPDTQERYDKTVQNWSNAYLDMAEMVAGNLKKKGAP